MADIALYINNTLASGHGVRMGDGFLNTLRKPIAVKDYITNTSRLEHGTRVIVKNTKISSQSLSLTFHVHGKTRAEYDANLAWLYGELYKGEVVIHLTNFNVYNVATNANIENPYFHLVYKGKSINYGADITRTMSKVTVGFDEPNPSERGNRNSSVITKL